MAQVVNATTIKKKLEQLNWPFQIAEVSTFLQTQSVTAAEFVAYLNACIATGDGVDDANISGCSSGSGMKISAALKNKGIML